MSKKNYLWSGSTDSLQLSLENEHRQEGPEENLEGVHGKNCEYESFIKGVLLIAKNSSGIIDVLKAELRGWINLGSWDFERIFCGIT